MKLINGDCIEEMKKLESESVDLILTDPPYLCDYARHDKESRFSEKIANDENTEENELMIKKYIAECYRIMKQNTALYLFCNYKKIDFFKREIEGGGYNIKNIIVWDKEKNGMGDLSTTYGYSYEFLIFATKGQPKLRGYRLADVWRVPRVTSEEQVHQNQKPVSLLETAIEHSSDKGQVVFDGFMGSGSTGVACVNLERDFIGIELKKEYFELAEKRIVEAERSFQPLLF